MKGLLRLSVPVTRTTLIIFALYLALAVGIVLISGGHSFAGPNRYGTAFANAFLEHWAFVRPEDPSIPYTGWPPGFPLFMIPFVLIEGETAYSMLAGFIILHIGTAFFVRQMTESMLHGYGDLGFALTLLNPNSLAAVFHNEADHLYAVIVTLAFAAAVAFLRQPQIRVAILLGVLLGVATSVRPAMQYLLLVLPIGLPFLTWVSGHMRLRRDIAAGVAALLAAAAILLPWSLHMWRAGEGIGIASNASQALFLEENIAMIETDQGLVGEGVGYQDVRQRVRSEREAYLSKTIAGYESFSLIEKSRLQKSFMMAYLVDRPYPISVWVSAVVRSWSRTLAAGGEGDLLAVLGIDPKDPERHATIFGIKVTALSFSLAMRVLGLIGIVELVRRREYGLLLLILTIATYMAAAHLGVGRPRFRVAIEAPLMVLSLFGISFLRNRLGGRSVRSLDRAI